MYIVHDYLTQRGGAERVVLQMLKAFPDAKLLTSIYEPSRTYPEFRDVEVNTLWPSRVAFFRRHHRSALPVLATAFAGVHLQTDIICSSSGWAHGVHTTGRKLVYCYTPARWLYYPESFTEGKRTIKALALRAASASLKAWDAKAMMSANSILTSSTHVAGRISDVYGRSAAVLPPPMTLQVTETHNSLNLPTRYALIVSRLLPYKNLESAVEVCARVGLDIVIVGSGPLKDRLSSLGSPHLHLLEGLSDAQLDETYRLCTILIAPAEEDFGLTPLEAAARGKPTVALARGGYLDTVLNEQTGVFYQQGEMQAAVEVSLERKWNVPLILEHAAKYSAQEFRERLRRQMAAPDEVCADDVNGNEV